MKKLIVVFLLLTGCGLSRADYRKDMVTINKNFHNFHTAHNRLLERVKKLEDPDAKESKTE